MVEPRSHNNGAVISKLRENGEHGNVAAALDASPQVEAEMAHELSYTIGDEPSFTYFINELRHILSDHENSADICDGRSNEEQNHPLLSKPRADQQPSRWISIKLLHVVKGKKETETTTSITLVMRDDNVDVVGFINKNGAYELGYRRTMVLPAEADAEPNSSVVLLGWGNSYKSILGVRTEEETMDRLTSANLGKAFATAAVDALSRFDPNEVADGDNPRLQVVGLMFMVSESARLNHVHGTIARGWVNGNGFKRKLMTDHVWKYVEMSRRLRHWRAGRYEKPRPHDELRDICLVLNEEYDLLSFACPEMLKESFPDMLKVMSLATVVVTLQQLGDESQHMGRVCGKIAALIRDKHRNSAYFRVGSMLFTCTEGKRLSSNPMALELERSVVAVPFGWVLHIEVDLHIETLNNSNTEMKHLKVITLNFDNDNEGETMRRETYERVQVEVKITWNDEQTDFPPQLTRPVQVKMESGYLTLVYTIGDEMSFTEFIMALRRILADHPYREELLDGHDLLNLSSSREHPLLARRRPVGPARWLLIELRVVEGSETSSTTLLLRDDDLYVHGFRNDNQGVWYELRDPKMRDSDQHAQLYAKTSIFPTTLNPHQLYWGVSYGSILEGRPVPRLASKALGRNFATDAVRRLSSSLHPDRWGTGGLISARLALAGLTLMVCESARFNPVHDFFVQWWNEGTRWRMELMEDYVWKYADMSMDLLTWKTKGYAARHPIQQLQAISLVLNTNRTRGGNPPDDGHQQLKPVAGNTGSGGGRPGPSHDDTGGDGAGKPNRVTNHGRSGSTQDHQRNKPHTAGSSGRKSEHTSAADSEGSPAGRQSEESSDAGSPGESDHSEESRDDSGSSGGNSSGQPGDDGEADDDTQCLGRPRVELLSMSADLGVIGRNIIVFDGKRGQIIYTKEEQGEKGKMDVLVLTGPYKGISAYGCFAILIDIPDDTAAGSSSSSGDAGGSIQWEWDCYDSEYAKEVDRGPVRHTIEAQDGSKVAEVAYAVMSNAREAMVQQVKLLLKDGPTSHGDISGEITAHIGGYKDEDKSILFSCGRGKVQRLSTTEDSCFLLQLARNVVAVPCGRMLHIQVDLQIVTAERTELEVKGRLSFKNGICSTETNDGGEVEVEVTWYPKVARSSHLPPLSAQEFITDSEELEVQELQIKMMSGEHLLVAVDTIRDGVSFSEFITALRRILAEHPDREDILEHPMLARQRAEQPARWVHIELQVVDDNNETLSTTLLMRDDDLYVHGFMNQQQGGVCCYELFDSNDGSVGMLPKDYNPKRLAWGINYRTILDVDSKQAVVDKLASAKLDKTFMVNAVRMLSRWSHSDQHQQEQQVPLPGSNTNVSARVALAGLIFMICESARMNSVRNSFAYGWTSGKGFTEELMHEYVCKYGEMSHELQAWKRRNYTEPHCISELQATYLVLNTCWSRAADYKARGHGPARVELLTLAMHPDFLVDGVKIVVFDGKRGQIIYSKDEQEQQEEKGQGGTQEMVDLVLTGPYRGISAEYGCFAIKIDIPKRTTSTSSGGDGHPPIKWEWDCDDLKHAAQVDTMEPAQGIISSPDGRKVAEVTYAVMSDAREATVKVKLQLKSGLRPVGASGKITALIDGFGVPSVLFSCTEEMSGNCLSSSTDGDSWFLLQLARNVVAVPCSRVLHIHVNLQIETDDGMGIELKRHLSFDNGTRSSKPDNGNDEVQVEVTWYPQQITSKEADSIRGPWQWEWYWRLVQIKETDQISIQSGAPPISEVATVSEEAEAKVTGSEEYGTEAIACTIGDGLSFLSFIMDLRRVAANHRDQEDILGRHHDSNLRSTREHPVLPKKRWNRKPERWLHVKLETVQGNETWSTTLAMRNDDLYVEGFRNKQGVWYGLLGQPDYMPPDEYSPLQILHWGTGYKNILRAGAPSETVDKLAAAHLGRDFAVDAVRRLSSSIPPDQEVDGLMSARLALAGLSFMACESARLNPVLDSIAGGWSTGTGFTKELVKNYVWMYNVMSLRLREWRRRNYAEPIPYSVLRAVHLVLND